MRQPEIPWGLEEEIVGETTVVRVRAGEELIQVSSGIYGNAELPVRARVGVRVWVGVRGRVN